MIYELVGPERFAFPSLKYALTPLSISVKPPATTHEVSIRQLEKWTARTSKSPRETALRSRVIELLRQRERRADVDRTNRLTARPGRFCGSRVLEPSRRTSWASPEAATYVGPF